MYDGKINQVKELLPILESVSQKSKSLLIIAEDIDGEALAAMIVNKMRSILKCCAVKAPDFGERRTHILEDIATLTGGTVISKQKGMRLDKITFDQLGTCRGITVEKEKTTIVDGNGTEEAITARLEEIKVPPVNIAISSNICVLLSPKSGALTAQHFKIPLILFTIIAANASPSISPDIISIDLFCCETASKIGNNSFTALILPSYNKIYGSSNCACIVELSVTK